MWTINESRNDLAKLFNGVGVEIGVEQGVFSEIICKTNFNVKLFCVDPWQPYKAYVDHQRRDKLERFCWRARKRLYPYNATILRKTSMEAIKDFADNSLDFVYIDANHSYKFVTEDITEWAKKVKPGGIVSGHDYMLRPERGESFKVKEAVDDYVKKNNIVGLTIYADDVYPSWMFRKP